MMNPGLLHHGLPVLSSEGRVIGRVEGRVDDDESNTLFAFVREVRVGGSVRLLPVVEPRAHPGAIQLPLPAARVERAPVYDPRGWRFEQVARARSYWGIEVSKSGRDTMDRFPRPQD